MAGVSRYALYIVDIDGTAIDEITGSGFSPNPQVQPVRPLGALDPSAMVMFGDRPTLRFETSKIDTVLGVAAESGLDCSTGIEFGYVERSAGGGYEAGGITITAAKCLVLPQTIVAAQDSIASISYTCLPYSSDGTTAPLAKDGTLPSGTPASSELFTIGAVTVGGVALGKPTNWSVDFGLAGEVLKKGELYPTDAVIRSRMPTAQVGLADIDEITTARLAGSEVSSVVFTLKKLSTTGGGYAGSGDVTITLAKAFMYVSDGGGSHPGDAAMTVSFMARKDAGDIIAIA